MHHLKKDQIKALVLAVPSQHRLMVLVGLWHGCRVSELINLRAKDVQHGYVRLVRLKGSLTTIQPWVLNSDPLLSEYEGLKELSKLGPETVLFPMTRFGVHKLIKKAGIRAGLPPHICRPHALKHSIAHLLLDGGKTINEVQRYLGHRSGSSTLRYLLATDEQASAGVGALL
jgi:integrase